MALSILKVRTASGTWTALNATVTIPSPPDPADPRGVTTPFHGRYRGAHNTGVPNMSALNTAKLGRTFSTANQTFNDEHFIGECDITATGITFNRCYFESNRGLYALYASSPATFNDCSFNGGHANATHGVVFGSANLTRCHLWGSGNHCLDYFGPATCQDCYIHGIDVAFGAHGDTFQVLGGSNVTVRRSKLLAYQTYSIPYDYSGCMQLSSVGQATDNLRIIDNYLDGAGSTLNGLLVGDPLVTNAFIDGNRFGRHYIFFAVSSVVRVTGTNGTFTATNVFDDTGVPV